MEADRACADAGIVAAVFQLLHLEGLLLRLAAFLGHFQTWRLRVLDRSTGQAICPARLPELRIAWSEGTEQGPGESGFSDPSEGTSPRGLPSPRKFGEPSCVVDFSGPWYTTPLVELVRSSSRMAPPHERRQLLQATGVRLLRSSKAALLPNPAGQTAVSWAAEYGHDELLRMLLGPLVRADRTNIVGRTINHKEIDGMYPLFRAAWNGHQGCVTQLLRAQADPEGLDPSGGQSPLMLATRGGHAGVVAELLKARAAPDRRNAKGEDALMLALHKSKVEKLLLDEGRRMGMTKWVCSRLSQRAPQSDFCQPL